MGSLKGHWVAPNADRQYDLLAGMDRLQALERALTSPRQSLGDDPAERAADWIQEPRSTLLILDDLEITSNGGADFPSIWEKFGWEFSLAGKDEAEQRTQTIRILTLLAQLPDATIKKAIDGISHWFSISAEQIVATHEGINVWLKLWPLAVEDANAKGPADDDMLLNTLARSNNDRELMDLDTLNTPVGKFVGVFLSACPTVLPNVEAFRKDSGQRQMRNKIEDTLGPAGSIVRYRLIEATPYFLAADKAWTLKLLVPHLLADSTEAFNLWRAVARQRFSTDVMAVLGTAMADRATDSRLSRDTRRSLVFKVVVDCLHAFKDKRGPAVSQTQVLQMIRTLDDEVRAEAAEAIVRFVQDVATPQAEKPSDFLPEQLFHLAVAPFLKTFWPQERSLATPGVSRALAELPASVQTVFAEAVELIERFLVPFECWSMLDYGLFGEEEDKAKLSKIDTKEKATAFLRLLDLTIGNAENSVVPYDLADALNQIKLITPSTFNAPVFHRLETAARRG